MAIKLVSLGDSKQKHGVHMMGYGQSGAGKTRLIDTLDNPIIIDAERGLASLERNDISVITVSNTKDALEAIRFLCSSDQMKKFTDIAIDSISKLTEIIYADAYLKHDGSSFKVSPEAFNMTVRIIKQLKSVSDKNIYMIAQCAEATDEDGVNRMMPLGANAKIQAMLPYEVDTVFAVRSVIFDGKEHDILQCKKEGKWIAKDRYGLLEKYEQPNLSKLISKLKGGN